MKAVFTVLLLSLALTKADEAPVSVTPAQLADTNKGWLIGMDRAKEKATAENKDMLLYFTGTDWCPPCIDLDEKIFSQAEFLDPILEKFILVKIEFLRDYKRQSEALQKANEETGKRYDVVSYPTIILADSNGRPYARTGWQAGEQKIPVYLNLFNGLAKQKEDLRAALATAAGAEGEEKTRVLAKAFSKLRPREVLNFYRPEVNAALAVDKFGGALAPIVFYEKIRALELECDKLSDSSDFKGILAKIEAFLTAEPRKPIERQEILVLKLGPLYRLQDFAAVPSITKEILSLGADTHFGKQAAQFQAVVDAEIKEKAAQKEEEERTKKNTAPKSVAPN